MVRQKTNVDLQSVFNQYLAQLYVIDEQSMSKCPEKYREKTVLIVGFCYKVRNQIRFNRTMTTLTSPKKRRILDGNLRWTTAQL